MILQPVVLSGGSGTRLWPLSRELFPKQFLPLTSDVSMLQKTVQRLHGMQLHEDGLTINQPLVICNEEHRFLVAEQLRQIEMEPAAIMLEPMGRNTAPALTLVAACIEFSATDAVLLVLPADHEIPDSQQFQQRVMDGFKLALQDYLVTFGIVPSHPETGYGYIQRGDIIGNSPGYEVSRFVEKPDLATASNYIEQGDYLWNSGIFMMKASVWCEAMELLNPEILEACRTAYRQGHSDQDFYRVDASSFALSPSDSIDYAVMERLPVARQTGELLQAAVLPLDAGWSDVGGWSALWDIKDKNAQGNVIVGDVIDVDSRDSLLYSSGRLLGVLGLDNIIAVETADAVLVADKSRSQEIKEIVTQLRENQREESQLHKKVFRPWGSYETLIESHQFKVKHISLKPGAAISLQLHRHRSEHWVVVSGTAKVTKGDKIYSLVENQSTYIEREVKHRLENPGRIPLDIIEVQTGSYLGEDDIERFEDLYGR